MINLNRLGQYAEVELKDSLRARIMPNMYLAENINDFLENKSEIKVFPEHPAKFLNLLMPDFIKTSMSYSKAYIVFHNLEYQGIDESSKTLSISDIAQEIILPFDNIAKDLIEEKQINKGDRLFFTVISLFPKCWWMNEKIELYKVQKNGDIQMPDVSCESSENFLQELNFAY